MTAPLDDGQGKPATTPKKSSEAEDRFRHYLRSPNASEAKARYRSYLQSPADSSQVRWVILLILALLYVIGAPLARQ